LADDREPDRTGVAILDAALRVLVDFGVKRATVEQVAKYASVSHMTVYRRWPAKNDLLLTAVMTEFRRLFTDVYEEARQLDSFDDKVVCGFTGILWCVRSHPLMARELATEPEVVLPFLTTAAGPSIDMAIGFGAENMRRAAEADGLTIADPVALAEVLVRIAHSLLLAPHSGPALQSKAEVADYARRYILPITRSAAVPA
jgi:AcrR family transcriptional regulator